ncbi:MAG: ribosome biogenesis GTP-binding protein YsxC [Deltaproteobacteria bacterium]|nr:ribosome biogenesis GTP-binding protein YsxC [Deltaproteobacteria bacterium]
MRAHPRVRPQPRPEVPRPCCAPETGANFGRELLAVAAAARTATGAPAGSQRGRTLRVVSAQFVAAVTRAGEVPAGPPEVAFVGRSNVGKSSLINALCNQTALARTSKTPGRTQAVVLFDAQLSSGQALRLVDLPGFGHAAVSKTMLAAFSEMIQFYLLAAEGLKLVVILQDCRRDRDDDAIGFAGWLRDNRVPYEVVATKADAVPATRRGAVCQRLQAEFRLKRLPLAVSARDRAGVDELLVRVRNAAFPKP